MNFRHDMQGKSPQQQAIVRQRDLEDKKRQELADQKKKEEKLSKVKYEPAPRKSQYEAIYLKENEEILSEVRISYTVIAVEFNELLEDNMYDIPKIHEWLYQIAIKNINNIKKNEIIFITATDVRSKKLVTSWKNLKRVDNKNI